MYSKQTCNVSTSNVPDNTVRKRIRTRDQFMNMKFKRKHSLGIIHRSRTHLCCKLLIYTCRIITQIQVVMSLAVFMIQYPSVPRMTF